MKHAVIVCHPRRESFTRAVAETYVHAVHDHGHTAIVRDLYAIGFDPVLKAGEIPGPGAPTPGADVTAERAMLADADVFVLVFPMWMGSMPAMLKGYLERVFGYGFAYGKGPGGVTPLLSGRKLIAFSASGAPNDWLVSQGIWQAARALQDTYFGQICGLVPIDHVHFGAIAPNMRKDMAQRHFDEVRRIVASHF
jgi:NAD(P)H dehydrogenase (quinone)